MSRTGFEPAVDHAAVAGVVFVTAAAAATTVATATFLSPDGPVPW